MSDLDKDLRKIYRLEEIQKKRDLRITEAIELSMLKHRKYDSTGKIITEPDSETL